MGRRLTLTHAHNHILTLALALIQSQGGWLTQWVVGFTKTIVLAGYTSVAVSILVRQQATDVSTFDEAIAAGYRFCANADLREGLIARYPKLAPLLVDTSNSAVLERMDEGKCEAGLLHADNWVNERMDWGQGSHCQTKARLVETVAFFDNSIPVRDDLVQAVSWAITHAVEAGRYAGFANKGRQNYTETPCPEASLTSRKVELGVSDLGAPLFFLLFVAFASLLMTRAGHALRRRSEKLARKLDMDGDGNVSNAEVVTAIRTSVGTTSTRFVDKLKWLATQRKERQTKEEVVAVWNPRRAKSAQFAHKLRRQARERQARERQAQASESQAQEEMPAEQTKRITSAEALKSKWITTQALRGTNNALPSPSCGGVESSVQPQAAGSPRVRRTAADAPAVQPGCALDPPSKASAGERLSRAVHDTMATQSLGTAGGGGAGGCAVGATAEPSLADESRNLSPKDTAARWLSRTINQSIEEPDALSAGRPHALSGSCPVQPTIPSVTAAPPPLQAQETALIRSPNHHPSQAGQQALARARCSPLLGNSTAWADSKIEVPFSPEATKKLLAHSTVIKARGLEMLASHDRC